MRQYTAAGLLAIFAFWMPAATSGNDAFFWSLDWSQAEDSQTLVDDNWDFRGDIRSQPTIAEAPFTLDSDQWLRLENHAGQNRFVKIPMRRLREPHTYELHIEAAVEPGEGPGLYLFFQIGTMAELRVDRHGVYLYDADEQRIMLGPYTPGQRLSVRLQVDTTAQQITAAWLGDEPVRDFKPVAWRSGNAPSHITVIGSTASAKDIYLKRIATRYSAHGNEDQPRWMQMPVQIDDMGESPQGLPRVAPVPEDELTFTIDEQRIAGLDLGEGFFVSREDLLKMKDLIERDRRAASTWQVITASARNTLAAGGFGDLAGRDMPRYVYQLGGRLPRFAFIYMVTGHEQLGELVREMVLDAIRRPMAFWIHDELRDYDPEWPVGRLETSGAARGMALALHWAGDLFDQEEREQIRTALRQRALDPCLRWLENPRPFNNFVAVIGNGALAAAVVLEDEAAIAHARDTMLQWLTLVEDDGSYGEQIEYFQYGFSSLLRGLMALGPAEAARILRASRVQHSLPWMIAYFSLGHDTSGQPQTRQINFGDDDFADQPNQLIAYFLAYTFDQGQGLWLADRFRPASAPNDFYTFLFRLMIDEQALPEPSAPAEANWPKVQHFDNGVGIIRSGWTMTDDVVLGLRSGGAPRTGYSHDVANRNAIALFIDGEYMIPVPGRASYRSPLRRTWDFRTSSHNTITIDERNQLREREACIVRAYEDDHLAYLASDATGSYYDEPEFVGRHVLSVRDGSYLLIWDEVRLQHDGTVQWQMHFANYDEQGKLEPQASNQWHFTRPGAMLRLWLGGTEMESPTVSDGIMHTGYSYSPGGPNEGTWGSSFKLQTTTPSARRAAEYFTLIVPRGDRLPGSAIEIEKHAEQGHTRLTVQGEGWHDEIRLHPGGVASPGRIEFAHRPEQADGSGYERTLTGN